MTAIVWEWCLKQVGVPTLYISEAAQLDILVPFLHSLPADAFLGAYNNFWSRPVLCVTDASASASNRLAAQSVLTQLYKKTIRPFEHLLRFQETSESVIKILDELPSPLSVIDLQNSLSSIGSLFTLAVATKTCSCPLRTPTECLVALMDCADRAVTSGDDDQSLISLRLKKRAEEMRLRNDMSMTSVKALLEDVVCNIEFSSLGSVQSLAFELSKELESHGIEGPPLPRLLDNVYGRAWETLLNGALLDDVPPKVLEPVHILQEEMISVVMRLTASLSETVYEKIAASAASKLPRSWSDRDDRVQQFVQTANPDRQRFLNLFSEPVTTGGEVAGTFFMWIVLILVLKEAAPDHIPWRIRSNELYDAYILPSKGTMKFLSEPTEKRLGSGIMLRHQQPIDSVQASQRVVINRTWDLDEGRKSNVVSPAMLALRQGIPFASGMSGHTCLFIFLFMDIQSRRNFDMLHALLGLFVYLVYDGGHPWNECLQAWNYVEAKLGLGILTDCSDPEKYQSDYSRFISLFDGSETEAYLTRAIQLANDRTLHYRRKLFSSTDSV